MANCQNPLCAHSNPTDMVCKYSRWRKVHRWLQRAGTGKLTRWIFVEIHTLSLSFCCAVLLKAFLCASVCAWVLQWNVHALSLSSPNKVNLTPISCVKSSVSIQTKKCYWFESFVKKIRKIWTEGNFGYTCILILIRSCIMTHCGCSNKREAKRSTLSHINKSEMLLTTDVNIVMCFVITFVWNWLAHVHCSEGHIPFSPGRY